MAAIFAWHVFHARHSDTVGQRAKCDACRVAAVVVASAALGAHAPYARIYMNVHVHMNALM